MNIRKIGWATSLLFLVGSGLWAQRIQLKTAGGADICPGMVTSCASPNPVRLAVNTNTLPTNDPAYLPFDPDDHNLKRRFKAFWITGDGNFLSFPDSPTDADSRNPSPYRYPAAGTYTATTYLTGKYTNREWPKRTAMQVITTAATAARTARDTFHHRLRAGQSLDLTSNQAIRKKNLTAFVISYAQAKQASGIYFFYNGATNTKTKKPLSLNAPLLRYSNTEIPTYFTNKINTVQIRSYESTALRVPGNVDGLTFSVPFQNLSLTFRDFVYFPTETATAQDMPGGFSEKRLFPVLQADSTFTPQDTLLNFFVVLTGPEPIAADSKLDALLRSWSPDLILANPITSGQLNRSTEQQKSARAAQAPTAGAQYIQAAFSYSLPYQVTFDPNQLSVEKITPLGNDRYEVTFRLEMCNRGQGNVLHEMVSLHYPANFQDFTPTSAFTLTDEIRSATNWDFKVMHTIAGRPSEAHESECYAISFTAKTNCEGVRSLWSNNPQQPVEACVIFEGAIDDRPECHVNFPIDSAQFQENGRGICTEGKTAGGTDWILWLILLLVALIVGRKVYEDYVS